MCVCVVGCGWDRGKQFQVGGSRSALLRDAAEDGPEEESYSAVQGMSSPGRENSKCRLPATSVRLLCLRHIKEATWPDGASKELRNHLEHEVQEAGAGQFMGQFMFNKDHLGC